MLVPPPAPGGSGLGESAGVFIAGRNRREGNPPGHQGRRAAVGERLIADGVIVVAAPAAGDAARGEPAGVPEPGGEGGKGEPAGYGSGGEAGCNVTSSHLTLV